MKKKPWEKMTKAEKRVAIAKDVLHQLDLKKLIPAPGVYVRAGSPWKKKAEKETAPPAKECTVCALGALFVSLPENKPLTYEALQSRVHRGPYVQEVWREQLRAIFTPQQLSLIESAFEESDFIDLEDTRSMTLIGHSPVLRRAMGFAEQHCPNGGEPSEQLLRAIMQNIIDNKGTFKP